MSTANTKPNFFLLLEIPYDAPWDQANFDTTIRKKRIEWSRKSSGVGRSATEAKKNLELVQEIIRVMSDPAEREKQAQEARVEQASKQTEDLEHLKKELEYINAKGYIEQAELDQLISKFSSLPASEIRKQLKVPIGSKPAPQSATQTTQPLEESLFKRINDQLDVVHVTTLYQLLGLDHTTSSAKLSEAAKELYNDMVRRQPSVETNAKKDLSGLATSIFGSAEKRQSYDESLRLLSLNNILKDLIEVINRSSEKEVTAGQVRAFLEQARKAGWKDEVAQAKLIELARQRKWFVHLAVVDQQAQHLLRCGHCNEMNEPTHKFCRNCQKELVTNCPSCGKPVHSDDIGCSSCGFAVGNRYYVDDLLAKVAVIRDPHEALLILNEAGSLWNPRQPDQRALEIRKLRSEREELLEAQKALQDQLTRLIDQSQLFQAQQFMVTHRGQAAFPQHYQQQIDTGIAQARAILSRAQTIQDQEEKANLYRQALRICADYREARNLLSTIPPAPATNLRAKVNGTLVSLSWNLSHTQGVSYKVIRKAGSKPGSVNDGTLLATITMGVYDDTQAESGVALYYAVFTECEGVMAPQPALLNSPIFFVQDVQNETVEVNDGQITLKWRVPSNVHTVLVVRKEGVAPHTPDDGIHLATTDPSYVIDRAVANGQVYYYGIYCQFNNQGTLLVSPGKVIRAQPEAPPTAITELDVSNEKTQQGYRVHLRWQPPSKGSVVVLKSSQSTKLDAGQVLPVTALPRYGKILESERQTLTDDWPQQGSCYYTPIVLFSGMAYIGAETQYACIDDVGNVHCENLGTALRLRWDWPPQCQEVAISYSYDGWLGRPQATHRIMRAEYDNFGYFDIKGDLQHDYYIRVSALIRRGQELLQGAGARVQARLVSQIVLTYEIQKVLFSKKRMLHIYTRTPATLPTLLLVSSRGQLSFKKTDGEPLWRMEGPIRIEKEVSYELPSKTYTPQTFGKLYIDDNSAYEFIKVLHPSDAKLRLD